MRSGLVILWILLLPACGLSAQSWKRDPPPGPHDRQAVVLLRVIVEANDQPVDTLQWWKLASTGGSSLDVLALDTGPVAQRVAPDDVAPGEPDQPGWFAFTLAPGTYHVQFVPPHRSSGASRDPRTGRWDRRIGEPDPTFWFHVSGSDPVVYVGSLHVSCTGPLGLDRLGMIDRCGALRVVDESAAARAVSPDRRVTTALMQEYGGALGVAQRDELVPLRLVAASTEAVNPPPWVMRGIARALDPDPQPGQQPWWVRTGMQGVASGLGLTGVGLPVFIAYQAAVVGSGALVGGLTAAQWKPCVEGLADAVRRFDVGTAWYASLPEPDETVVAPDEVDTVEARSVLQTELRRVQLRECRTRDTFCVEVALRARLWDVSTNALLFDETLRYGNAGAPTSSSEHAAYEIPLADDAPCRPIETYCAAHGRALLTSDLAAAVAAAAARVQHQLALQPRPVTVAPPE